MATCDIEKGTDETFDFLCSVCKGKNKNTEAKKFCLDCNDYYCSTCVKCHEDIPALKSHQILDKTQFQSGPSKRFPQVPTQRCTEHNHKTVDMYCKRHDVVGCSICMVNQHSSCREKLYVPDYIKSNAKAVNPTYITGQLKGIAKGLAELKNTFVQDKQAITDKKVLSLKQIRKFRADLNQILDELEKETVKDLEIKFQSVIDATESELNKIQALTKEVESAQDSLKSAGGNASELFVSIKTATVVASRAQEMVSTTKSQVNNMDLSFVANMTLQTSLRDEVQALGSIVLTKQQLRPTNLDSNTQPDPNSGGSQPKRHIKGNNEFPVKVQSDRDTCHILSACCLEDGTIVLADRRNNKLKCLDNYTYIVKKFCDVPSSPSQVCATGKQEVAVSCYDAGIIQFVSVKNKMKKTRMISTGFNCRGLTCADGKLFVSDDTSVYVYTMTGNRLQQFDKEQSGQGIIAFFKTLGQSLFSDIRSLAVSEDNSKIYIADSEKGLIILDRSGSLAGRYNGPELQAAYDVCLYKNGSVLVCGLDSWNILQFSCDGNLMGEVLKTDTGCQSVCCNKNRSQLIVGMFMKDKIEVYDIK